MLGYNPGLYQMQIAPPLEREYSYYEGMRSNFLNELMWARTDGELERTYERWRTELQALLTGGFINPMIYNMEHQNMEAIRRTRLKEIREGKVAGLGFEYTDIPPLSTWWPYAAVAVLIVGGIVIKRLFSRSRA